MYYYRVPRYTVPIHKRIPTLRLRWSISLRTHPMEPSPPQMSSLRGARPRYTSSLQQQDDDEKRVLVETSD